jgi:hypothetical protein
MISSGSYIVSTQYLQGMALHPVQSEAVWKQMMSPKSVTAFLVDQMLFTQEKGPTAQLITPKRNVNTLAQLRDRLRARDETSSCLSERSSSQSETSSRSTPSIIRRPVYTKPTKERGQHSRWHDDFDGACSFGNSTS